MQQFLVQVIWKRLFSSPGVRRALSSQNTKPFGFVQIHDNPVFPQPFQWGGKSSYFCACVKSRYLDVIDQTRFFGSQASPPLVPQELSQNAYEEIVDESLESLYTYFDEVLESSSAIKGGDVSYSSGVLTIKLGKHGTYVINKQTPNRQIWLSSPSSGPKRYDFIDKTWIYRHDGVSLYALLNSEIPKILGLSNVDFEKHCNIHQNN